MPTLQVLSHERESIKAIQAKALLRNFKGGFYPQNTSLVGNQGEISGTPKASIAPHYHLGVINFGTK